MVIFLIWQILLSVLLVYLTLMLSARGWVFSKINLYKTKIRNHLKTDTVNGALLSSECIKEQKSCINFKPSEGMIARVKNSSVLYQDVKDDSE